MRFERDSDRELEPAVRIAVTLGFSRSLLTETVAFGSVTPLTRW